MINPHRKVRHLFIFFLSHMMTSSNGNIFRVTDHLCGEFPGEFPTQRPVTWSFDIFFDFRLNKRLSKQWWGWRFETRSRLSWCHCNATQSVQLVTHLCYMYMTLYISIIFCTMTAAWSSALCVTHIIRHSWSLSNNANERLGLSSVRVPMGITISHDIIFMHATGIYHPYALQNFSAR